MADTYFLKGSWNVICDRCGHKYKAQDLRKEWTGLMVCNECWEPRHPQDFLRTTPDIMSVPYVRPRPADVFVPIDYQRTFLDLVHLEEALSTEADYIRYIPVTQIKQLLPPTERPLNSIFLNGRVLGGLDSAIPSTDEMVHIGENTILNVSRTMPADTVSFGETFLYFIGTLIDESVHVAESLSGYIVAEARYLNGSALNRGALG